MLESYLLRPSDKPSDTALVFMHPIGGGAYLPMINALARPATTSSTATAGFAAPTRGC
ncbi:alpha/beta hydrolase domain protein [Mycobacterium kansasii]|uniref:Alpha/beta hydrolase domain protein n=1 Tax=Mycobacterium kansasii TaxID=1768 RepID=A0A1V3XUW1_MYCKA|nr:alpha/beta hydrolase domain protein [Mycobacterium kansasii]